jgi:hypothetical protein
MKLMTNLHMTILKNVGDVQNKQRKAYAIHKGKYMFNEFV